MVRTFQCAPEGSYGCYYCFFCLITTPLGTTQQPSARSSLKLFPCLQSAIVSLCTGLRLLLCGRISLLPFNCPLDNPHAAAHNTSNPIAFVCASPEGSDPSTWGLISMEQSWLTSPSSVKPSCHGKSSVVGCVFFIVLQ